MNLPLALLYQFITVRIKPKVSTLLLPTSSLLPFFHRELLPLTPKELALAFALAASSAWNALLLRVTPLHPAGPTPHVTSTGGLALVGAKGGVCWLHSLLSHVGA